MAKKFEQFINEDMDRERLDKRKKVKSFINAHVINKYDGNTEIRIISVKPWKEDTDVNIVIEGYYSDRETTYDSFIKSIKSLEEMTNKVKDIFDGLNLEFTIKKTTSYGVSIFCNIKDSYFEDNKDLLNSLDGLKKFNM